MSHPSNRSKLHVVIRESAGVLWQGPADSFSSTNEIGVFDILPEHAHFVGSIKQFIKVVDSRRERQWDIKTGVISVVDNQVDVFLGY